MYCSSLFAVPLNCLRLLLYSAMHMVEQILHFTRKHFQQGDIDVMDLYIYYNNIPIEVESWWRGIFS